MALYMALARDPAHDRRCHARLQQELKHLAQADRHLAEGERRIADQIILIEELTAKGHDTTGAEKLLRNFEQARETWRVHRQLILDTLERG
jgi:multidrug resistance efflux pump